MAKTKVQDVAVPVAAVGAIGLGGYLLWGVLKSVRDTFDNLGGALDDASGAVGSVVHDASKLTEVAATGALWPGIQNGVINQDGNKDGTKKTVEKPDLDIRVLTKDDEVRNVNLFLDIKAKYTRVTLKVVDKKTGRGVPFATIHGSFKTLLTAKVLGKIKVQTDNEGYYRNLNWTVRDVAGTAKEDDLVVFATAPGYNDSQKVVLK